MMSVSFRVEIGRKRETRQVWMRHGRALRKTHTPISRHPIPIPDNIGQVQRAHLPGKGSGSFLVLSEMYTNGFDWLHLTIITEGHPGTCVLGAPWNTHV